MTSEQMRAELEREGYSNVRYYDLDVWILPDGITRLSTSLGQQAMTAAYAHLQAQRKLVALEAENTVLRDCVLSATKIGGEGGGYSFMAELKSKAISLVQQFNITADESDDDE